jgi:signal peptide peptidase SppA
MGNYEHVLSFALEHPWAITRPMLSLITSLLARRIAGEETSRAEIEAALTNRKNLPQPRQGSAAIIPVYGVIAPRMNMLSEMSGGTTFEKLSGQLREVMGNSSIKTVVLDIDSPGGNVAGASEFAREVMRARTKKPIIAQIQYTGASAAYWVASAATEIVAAPSASVGSVGVYTSHDDLSAALEKLGIKRTYISAGKGKVDGNETEAITDSALDRITAMVDTAYARMVGDIVKGRGQGVTDDKVRDDWKAHTYGAKDALSMGMIDGIATLDETLARVLSASSDAADRTAALALSVPSDDTSQDLETDTDQDRRSDAHWQHLALLDL